MACSYRSIPLRVLTLASLVLRCQSSWAATLPIPCVGAASCGAAGPTKFVTSGSATATQSANTLTVQQNSNNAILNWAQFNVSADGKVIFNQPSATSVALNRIYQNSPSSIFGQVTANGQIYLLNPNGFLFGAASVINVGGLVASSLGISDSTFNSGLLSPGLLQNHVAALDIAANQGQAQLDANGNPIEGQISIAAGAQITAASGGRVLIASPVIQNAGSIQAPDGQIILAAGQKVYLQASTDPNLRGLVVEVDGGGTASNQLNGMLSAARGNITLVGLAVNQDGRISATTSVAQNGSVRLEAADTTAFAIGQTGTTISSTHGGTVELGPGSQTQILPEIGSSDSAVADQPQAPSQIAIAGQQVFMHGATITAPGGTLNVVAAANPELALATPGALSSGNSAARIRIDDATSIDLSGSDADLPMSANLVAVQLRASELADDPTQRNGALRGKTVYIDARVGTTIADVAADLAAVPETVAQRTEAGGHASFQSEGDVVFAQGSTINVSGGHTTYEAGTLQTTKLIGANGQLYDIGTANPLQTYTGVFNPSFTQTYDKWGVQDVLPTPGLSHYQPGYVQGAAAGSVQFAAPSLVLNGNLVGHSVNGPYQRTATTMVPGGQLIIGLKDGLLGTASGAPPDFLSPAISFVAQGTPIVVSDNAALPVITAQLPTTYLQGGGFTSTTIYGDSKVTLPNGLPLELNPGGVLSVYAPRIDILSDITAPGGTISLNSVLAAGIADPSISRPGILIGSGATLDVRGQFTNDFLASNASQPSGPTLQNGGTINLSLSSLVPFAGGELVLGDDASLRASGGAWINHSGVVTGGTGGTISIDAAFPDSALQVGGAVHLDAYGVQGAAGGTFDLGAARLLVAQGGSDWTFEQRVDNAATGSTAFEVDAPLFSNYGFSRVNLSAYGVLSSSASPANALTIESGTTINALSRTLQLSSGYTTRKTGSDLDTIATSVLLPQTQRVPENISLSVAPQSAPSGFTPLLGSSVVGLLSIQPETAIVTDPGGSISLSGVGGIQMDGLLRAPGGSVMLTIPSPVTALDTGFLPGLDLVVGPNAEIDVSGVARLLPNNLQLQLGSVLPGGAISLYANRGSVITDPGSSLNISGGSATLDVPASSSGSGYIRQVVGSAGGSLTVRAPESISLLGNLQAAAGTSSGARADGGSLEIDLTRALAWFSPSPGAAADATFPTMPRTIELVADTSGMQPSAAISGAAVIGVAQLQESGIDSLTLRAGDRLPFTPQGGVIELASALPLSLTRQIILDAPSISVLPGISQSLNAAYVSIGSTQPVESGFTPTVGNGILNVTAQQISLVGSTVLQGIARTTLTSSGDVQLLGEVVNGAVTGDLTLNGTLALNASRIYPATATSFTISAEGANGAISIGQTSPSPGTPLSAGGSVSLAADQISSSGTLIAPFGSIDLSAVSALSLNPGSVTSVSGGDLTIPFGETQLGGYSGFIRRAADCNRSSARSRIAASR
jgi:filamentous hemagglutinin